ncbi:MAG: mannosyl-3-phosphoglycerate phosphatase [Paraglaciecola sp.]|jgi:mannosyl-3-phosphoglycerate phosphatase
MLEQRLVFTDMDGTLMDHYSYSYEAAIPMLEKLKRLGIPVIPTTSKTFAELIVLRKEIGLPGPFITENGAAVFIPKDFFPNQPGDTKSVGDYWLKEFTLGKEHWLGILQQGVAQLGGAQFADLFQQFSQMTTAQICLATGLDSPAAKRAAQRQYGEPVLWLGGEKERTQFIQTLTKLGASPVEGGRFIHVCGNCDKGTALNWLVDEFSRQHPDSTCVSIALGDSKNDIAMLEAATIAVRILSPSNPLPQVNRTHNLYTSTHAGPTGWHECLTQILATSIKE